MMYDDLVLEPNRIQLSESVIYRLYLVEGELLDIVYDDNGNAYLSRSDTNGSKLRSNMSFSFKGKKHERLSKLGTSFKLESDLKLIGDNVITEFDYSKSFEPEPLDASVVLDNNYNIQKFKEYKL